MGLQFYGRSRPWEMIFGWTRASGFAARTDKRFQSASAFPPSRSARLPWAARKNNAGIEVGCGAGDPPRDSEWGHGRRRDDPRRRYVLGKRPHGRNRDLEGSHLARAAAARLRRKTDRHLPQLGSL